MDSFGYFPSVIYREERPEWVNTALVASEKHYESMKQYCANAGMNGPVLQTCHMAEDPDLSFIGDYFLSKSKEILTSQGYITERYEFYLEGMWGQDIQCNGGHRVHVHKNSQISGFFFMQTPENGSFPVFHDPRYGKSMVELDHHQQQDVTVATNAIYFNNVIPGTFLFFNSWLPHEIMPSSTNIPTKFIHFIVSHK